MPAATLTKCYEITADTIDVVCSRRMGPETGMKPMNGVDFAAAEQAFRQAIDENPDDARLHFKPG